MGPLIPLLFLAAQAISSISKAKKGENYQKNVEGFEKRQTENSDREARRASLARALGGNTLGFAPTPTELKPEAPSTEWEDILGAIGGIGGQVSGSYYGKSKVPKPYNPTSDILEA